MVHRLQIFQTRISQAKKRGKPPLFQLSLLFGCLIVLAEANAASIALAQSKPSVNAMPSSPVTTGVEKATRQVVEARDKQSIGAIVPMNGLLYITPELRYTVKSSSVDRNLRIMFQAPEGIVINHIGNAPGQAKLVLNLVDGRTVTIVSRAAKNNKAATYLVIR